MFSNTYDFALRLRRSPAVAETLYHVRGMPPILDGIRPRMKLALIVYLFALSLAAQTPSPSFEKSVQPFLANNCYACHNAKVKTADVDLQQFKTADSLAKEADLWEKAVQKMRTGEMPPKGFPPPKPADV